MKAIVYHTYGSPDALQLREVETPTPGDGQVLIEVVATAINAADRFMLRGKPFPLRFAFGLRQPKHPILGADVAGRVAAVGRGVTAFQPGDAVYGDLSGCGFGGLAQYVCAPESALAPLPAGVSFEAAAAVPMAAITALQGLRDKGRIQPGQRVLIYGASGGVGTFAVQLATAFGAEVTAVCSTRNVALARSLGATHVIDYTQEDFAQNGQQYDLILAANGYRPILEYRRALNPDGVYVMTGGSMTQIFQALLLGPALSALGRRKLTALTARASRADLETIGDLLASGQVRSVIDRCYPLSETAAAFRYLETDHARGKVIITTSDERRVSSDELRVTS